MLITDLSIRKMSKDDPRYPDQPHARGPFTEVYRMEATLDDGRQLETAFFFGPNLPKGDLTRENFATMLEVFAKAISRIEPAKAAA